MKNLLKILIVVLSILILVMLISTFTLLQKKNSSIQLPDNKFSGVFLPNFDVIRGTTDRGSEKWVAAQVAVRIKDNKVTFFSQKDGMAADNTTGVINHNDQIWFTSQGGVSKYIDNENRFKTYLVGESNINLFEDPYNKKLYASTFQNFFSFNDETDQWSRDDSGPINSHEIEFSKDFIIATSQQSTPAVIFDKQTGKWSTSSIPEFSSQEVFILFKSRERIFIYGRSKNYNGCGQYGKEPASLFFEYKNSQWTPVDVLNKTFANYEPYISRNEIIGNLIPFYNEKKPCSNDGINGGSLKTIVDFSGNDVKIVSQNDVPTGISGEIKDSNSVKAIKEISKITGLKPNHKILSFEDNIILSQAKNSDGSLSFTQISLNGQNYNEKELISSKDLGDVNIFGLTSCSPGNTKYLSVASVSEYDGSGKNYQLYKVVGDNIQKVNADVSGLPVGNPNQFVCEKGSLYWAEGADIKKADVEGDKINITIIKDLKDFGDVSVSNDLSKDGKIWFSFFDKKDKLFSFDLASQSVNQYSIPLPMDKLRLIDVTLDYFWFANYLNPNSELVKIDFNGNATKRYAINGSLQGVLDLESNKYLVSSSVQLSILDDNSGEFKTVDDKLLPFYSQPSSFMPSRSSSAFIRDGDNILFKEYSYSGTGNFIIPMASLMK